MLFVVSTGPIRDEYVVTAVDPLAGNDSALLAVFNNQASADRLAERLNFLEALFNQCQCSIIDDSNEAG